MSVMDCFQYPLDTEQLLRKKRRIRRELLAQNPHPLKKRGCTKKSLSWAGLPPTKWPTS